MKLFQAVVAIALAASLVVASGCSSSPTESVSETPESTPTPTVSTPPTQEQLYEQAKVVYERIYKQELELQYAGGANELPPAFLELVTEALATDYAAIYGRWKRDGTMSLGPDPQVVWIRPYGKSFEQSVVSLGVCTDGSKTRVLEGDGSVALGRPVINYFYFKYFDGVLKAFDSDDKRVAKC